MLLLWSVALGLVARSALGQSSTAPAPQLAPATSSYTINVTVGLRSPDCFSRPVILANGQFLNLTLEVTQGDFLEVTVINSIPSDYPLVTDGISIHWHGLNQRSSKENPSAEWYDGVAYISSCPIQTGQSFTYRFKVDDTPGTYFWHGHAGMELVDGLQGPLIVRPRAQDPIQSSYDEERTLLLMDWYHDLYGPLTYATSRPFDDSKVTNTSGSRVWVDVPQATLINGMGFYKDCSLGKGGSNIPPTCNVTTAVVPAGRSAFNPDTAQANQGCKHYNLTVEPGKKYRLRLINAGSLAMQTFYVEGHNLTIVAADATPTDPISVPSVDVNIGQRYDVILTANAEPRTYYLVSQPQYRNGAPAGFGFLTYSNSNVSLLPPTPTPTSNATAPWTLAQISAVHTAAALVAPSGSSNDVASGLVTGPVGATSLAVPSTVDVNVFLNNSQPVLKSGQLHWAFNDITTYKTPACTSLLSDLYTSSQSYLSAYEFQPGNVSQDISLLQTANSSISPQIYKYGSPASAMTTPVPGQYFVEVARGDVVEVVIQNLKNNDSNGDIYLESAAPALLAGRGANEQHAFHLHGHHFWVVGTGNGTFNSTSPQSYNLQNPIYRDVYTLPMSGWAAIRFVADNPGVWQLHCHIPVHLYMGQEIYFAEAIEDISEPPADLPVCPQDCQANFAGWAKDYVAAKFGSSGFI